MEVEGETEEEARRYADELLEQAWRNNDDCAVALTRKPGEVVEDLDF